ncbi:MAG: energy-coupling factor transporter transmembrane protein EcfT [Marinisporobacter sp.]|nr:energy-coupling factor transporter transmembrane protein EcfT [Marinisporobacter sp.]
MFTMILFFMTLAYSHPLYIGSILVFVIVSILSLGEGERLKRTIKYGMYTALMIMIINPLVSHSGRSIIYRSPKIPVLGKIKITWEAVAFGSNMALKLFCITLIFLFYSLMTDRDETFSFFSKYAHKLTLTLSMTTNIIHRLKLEIMRVRDVMILRGVNFNEKNLIRRVKSYYPILKVIFISSLEGSLDRAESLYSRGYGKGLRTSYSQIKIKKIDYIFHGINLILLFLFGYGIFIKVGTFEFYPILEFFEYRDIFYLIFIDVTLCIAFFLIWGCKRWKFLKYKI